VKNQAITLNYTDTKVYSLYITLYLNNLPWISLQKISRGLENSVQLVTSSYGPNENLVQTTMNGMCMNMASLNAEPISLVCILMAAYPQKDGKLLRKVF